jgi:calcium/calmodulin-dependent protein kinase I
MTPAETFFSRYQIDYAIGNAQYSRVYLATQKSTGHRVALKVLLHDPHDHQLIPRSRIMSGDLDNPHLVHLIDIYEDANIIFIVMEPLPSGSLFDWIASRGPISEAAVARIMWHLCIGVKTLHDHRIVHRNIKPENILLSESESGVTVKLTDYCLGQLVDKSPLLKRIYERDVCCAPELLLECQEYDKSVDIWSLGVIAYILLCGRRPIEEDELYPLAAKARAQEIAYDFKEWEIISADGVDFVGRMLQAEPGDRITVDEALAHRWLKMDIKEMVYGATFKNFQVTTMGRAVSKAMGAMSEALCFAQFSQYVENKAHMPK